MHKIFFVSQFLIIIHSGLFIFFLLLSSLYAHIIKRKLKAKNQIIFIRFIKINFIIYYYFFVYKQGTCINLIKLLFIF